MGGRGMSFGKALGSALPIGFEGAEPVEEVVLGSSLLIVADACVICPLLSDDDFGALCISVLFPLPVFGLIGCTGFLVAAFPAASTCLISTACDINLSTSSSGEACSATFFSADPSLGLFTAIGLSILTTGFKLAFGLVKCCLCIIIWF